jgi:hypothetical protein
METQNKQSDYDKLLHDVQVYRYYNTVIGKPIISAVNLARLEAMLIELEKSGEVNVSPDSQTGQIKETFPNEISSFCEEMHSYYTK